MSAFRKIAVGLEEALAYAEGRANEADYRVHVPPAVDVKAVRKARGLSQEAFAARYGFTVGRIRDWEQRRSAPDGSSRLLLRVIEREPEAVERALSEK